MAPNQAPATHAAAAPPGQTPPPVAWRAVLDPRRLSITHLWVIVALGSIGGYVVSMPVDSADFWHYLEAGDHMVRTGSILDHERFSFSAAGRPFINLHWGSQVVFSTLYRTLGLNGLVCAHAVLITLAFAAVFAALRTRGATRRAAAVAVLVAFVVGAPGLALRPQGFSVLLFAATIYLVERRRLWALPPLFLVWANLHAAFPVGLAWLALRVLFGTGPATGASFDAAVHAARRRWLPPTDIPLALAAAGAACATLCTPWGWHLYPAVLDAETVSRMALIDEWSPITVTNAPGRVFFGVLAALLVAQHAAPRRWRVAETAVLLAFTFLVLRQQRALVWWALALAPTMAATLTALGAGAAGRLFVPSPAANRPRPADRVGLNWAIAGLLGLHLVFSTPWLKSGYLVLPPEKRLVLAPDTPVAMARAIASLPGPRRVFAEMTWGGYLSWALDDQDTVFYDARVLPFPPDVIRDYVRVSLGHADWQRILDRYGADTLAVSRALQPLLAAVVESAPGWQVIYADAYGIACRRVQPAPG